MRSSRIILLACQLLAVSALAMPHNGNGNEGGNGNGLSLIHI